VTGTGVPAVETLEGATLLPTVGDENRLVDAQIADEPL
jgi:hypothetical protein